MAPAAAGRKQSLPHAIPGPVTVPKPVPPFSTVRSKAPTSIVTVSVALPPAPSAALAVITCVPSLRSLTGTLNDPLPSGPSRLDDHAIASSSLPASRSCAIPSSVTSCSPLNSCPLAGPMISTSGALFATANGGEVAVAVWTPSETSTRRRESLDAVSALRSTSRLVSVRSIASAFQELPPTPL